MPVTTHKTPLKSSLAKRDVKKLCELVGIEPPGDDPAFDDDARKSVAQLVSSVDDVVQRLRYVQATRPTSNTLELEEIRETEVVLRSLTERLSAGLPSTVSWDLHDNSAWYGPNEPLEMLKDLERRFGLARTALESSQRLGRPTKPGYSHVIARLTSIYLTHCADAHIKPKADAERFVDAVFLIAGITLPRSFGRLVRLTAASDATATPADSAGDADFDIIFVESPT
jgi:hypothetical protein